MTSNDSVVTPSWKRPWSLNEIIANSNNWSLAGDSGICELLKRFSSDLITDVTQVSYNLSELQIESKQLNVVMENVSNDLCMLANDQFIENLVEEVHGSGFDKVSQDVVSQSKEDKGSQTISLVLQSLRMGIQVLENQFEVIDVMRMGSVSQNFGDSDVESQVVQVTSDFPTSEPIYQPKDPYENRHLPHLIGTTDFIEDDTLGIGYIDDVEDVQEVSDDSASETGSVVPGRPRQDLLTSSSDDDDDQDNIESSGFDRPPPQPMKRSLALTKTSDNDQEEEDLFEDSTHGKAAQDLFNDNLSNDHSEDLFNDGLSKNHSKASNSVDKPESPPARPLTLTEQLNRQLKSRLSVGAKPSDVMAAKEDEPLSISSKLIHGKADEAKSTAPRKSIWDNDDDDDDEEDFFSVSTKHTSKGKPSTSTVAKPSPEQSKQSPNINSKESPQQKLGNQKPSIPVEDDSDSGDDFFKISQPVKPKEVVAVATKAMVDPKKNTSAMSDDSDDLFDGPSKNIKSLQNGSRKAMLTKTNTLIRPEKKESSVIKRSATVINPFRFSSDDDDEEDLFKPLVTKKQEGTVTKSDVTKSHDSKPIEAKPVDPKPMVTKQEDSRIIKSSDEKKPLPMIDQADNSEEDGIVVESSVKKINNPSELKVAKVDNKVPVDDSDSDDMFGDSSSKKKSLTKKVDSPTGVVDPIVVAGDTVTNAKIDAAVVANKSVNKNVESPNIRKKVTGSDPLAPLGGKVSRSPLSSDSDDIFATNVSSNKKSLPVIGGKGPRSDPLTDSKVPEKIDSPVIAKKESDHVISSGDKIIKTSDDYDSDDLFGGKDSSKMSSIKVDSPVLGKKDTKSIPRDTVPEVVSTHSTNKALSSGDHSKVDDKQPSIASLVSNDGSPDDIPSSGDSSRLSTRKLPAGAKSMFGDMSISNNSSLFKELSEKQRKSRPTIAVDSDDGGNDEQSHEDATTQQISKDSVSLLPTFQLPTIRRPKEDSPVEEGEVSLDAPVQVVNQLSNLTKTRARATNRRRPVTKKTEPIIEPTDTTAIVPDEQVKAPTEITTEPSTITASAISLGDRPAKDNKLSLDDDDIFANLPPVDKKSKSKKKESGKSRVSSVKGPVAEVDVTEIDDIFAVTNSSSTKKTTTNKNKKNKGKIIDDPLAAPL